MGRVDQTEKRSIGMEPDINFFNLWLFYVLAYAIALPMQVWANHKRGESFDDPEFLFGDRKIFPIALIWLISGFVISLFVPLHFGPLFFFGLIVYIAGMIIVGFTFYSWANHRGLVTGGIYRYSRNPGYVGWTFVIFGLCIMGWSISPWSILFLIYAILTLSYFHWTVSLEEAFLANKYGDPYRAYLRDTPRYFGIPKRENGL